MAATSVLVQLLRAAFVLVVVSLAVAASGLAAETPRPANSMSLDGLFESDNVYVDAEKLQSLVAALRQTPVPGACALGRRVVKTPEGDQIFQAAARRTAVLSALDAAGIDVPRLFVESIVEGDGNKAWLENAADQEKPRLDTRSAPENGSLVAARQVITVTMVASDDAEPRHRQTGIKTVQLVADSDGGRFIASENYQACGEPAQHRVVATYRVPDPPPLVVRLTALTEDHAGHMDTDVGEFPTAGDWYGHIEWSFHQKEDLSRKPNENRSEVKYDGAADLTVSYDGRGNLTGRLVGTQKIDTFWWGYPHGNGEVCRGSTPPRPVSARVLGSYTPGTRALTLQLVDVEAKLDVNWSGGGAHLTCSPVPPIDSGGTLQGLLGRPQAVDEDTYRSEFTSNEALQEVLWRFTLRRVRR